MKIYLFVSLIILSASGSIFSQNYINLAENTGVPKSLNENLFEAADSLNSILPVAYQDSFKVISTGVYLHNDKFNASLDEFLFRMKGLAHQESPYFLLLLRVFDENNIFKEFRTILALPSIPELSCYNQNYYLLLENDISNKMSSHFTSHKISAIDYYLTEVEGINYLTTTLSNIINCCDDDFRAACHICPETDQLRSQLQSFHLDSISAEIIAIESSELNNSSAQKREENEIMNLSNVSLLVDGVDTTNLNEALENFLSEIQDNGFSYFAIVTSDLNFCFTNESSARSEETPSLEELEELFNTSNDDFVIWINASMSSTKGDKLFIKFRSKIDSYFDLPLHDDLIGYNLPANNDVYPAGVIYNNPNYLLQPYDSYSFTLPASTLLSLVSEVPISLINQASVLKRGPGQFLPWYTDCGGGITIGDANLNWYNIYLTENYFKSSGDCPRGNETYAWLSLCSHEVRHIIHIIAITGNGSSVIGYLSYFALDYIIHGGHTTPREDWADIGSDNFDHFYDWIVLHKGTNALENLLNGNQGWDYQEQMILTWYDEYK